MLEHSKLALYLEKKKKCKTKSPAYILFSLKFCHLLLKIDTTLYITSNEKTGVKQHLISTKAKVFHLKEDKFCSDCE